MRSDDLDDLFSAARAEAPVPSAALLARVLADAEAAQPRSAPAPLRAAPARPAPRRGLW
ncbi:MAG: dihydroorotate dehydrogenase, partial [Rhodobacterales bacterium]|nr:dihydroorotate dehydrogenase [Rhodobacterales bacterium]